MPSLNDSRFLRACRREATDATPVWFMRQAGRYMPEYRAIREKVSMLDAIRTPAIAQEITLQPIKAFDLDAAILFSDILIPLTPMGIDLDFIKGEGPQINTPIRTLADVQNLHAPPAAETMPFIAEAVRGITAELTPKNIPLIGFCGAPFTLASYAIEGGGSKNYERTKTMLWNAPEVWDAFMEKLVPALIDYLRLQIEAGASVVQIFDSWAGALSPADFERSVAPYTRRLIQTAQAFGVPVIYFSTGTGTFLDQIGGLYSDVVSVDWRIGLDRAWRELGDEKAIQGNLDPVLLFAEWPILKRAVDEILTQANGRPGHIFNLGHGILPGTPVETVRRLADYVHEQTAR
jgi:uroporphyrinogen decarboxylase